MAAGRPTKYKPEYPEALIKHMSQGLSFETFAGLCDVWRETLYDWCDRYEEFHHAKKRGEVLSQLFWERLGRDAALGSVEKFNPTIWIYTMKCRFPKQWRDETVVINEKPKESEAKTLSNDDLTSMLRENVVH